MIMKIKSKEFTNGAVHLYKTNDGYPLEVTDTFLPYYTKNAIGRHQNCLSDNNVGSRSERWMIGVSTMSGCPVGCKFCATAKLKRCRNLTSEEIVEQVLQVISMQTEEFIWDFLSGEVKEFKINYTRMGEPFLNIENVKRAVQTLDVLFPNIKIHHYISTIGIKGADYSWIKDNVTLQFSVHSFSEEYRNWLIPFKHKITLEEMGKVETNSELKTTLNLTLARKEDFDIEELKKYFDSRKFFIKLSPINLNDVSIANGMDNGVITTKNLE
jgi:adenine C2-methylase RlmN of 23S rRNA A2503 and tRNA A37